MPIFFSIKLYVFIIYILVHIEIINSTKNNIRFLFENDGWKNLTDVEYINYWSKKYTLQKTLETPVTSNTCDTRIRSATIILGCSYANVLKTIFFIMDRFLEYCETLINLDNKNKNAFDCTTEIIKIIPKLSDLATLMKGALVSVDKLHRKPMANSKRNELILNNVTTRLHIEKALNLLSPIQVNQFNTKNILETIRNYFIYLRLDLENDLRLCHLKSLNLLSLWQLLSKKYRSSKENGSNQEFWTFMSYKIKSLIHWTIIERYNNLGFKFDWNTKETFLPNTSKKFETEHFEDPIIASTQMLNGDNIEEHFEDPIIASTQMLNGDNIEVKWSFKNYFSNKINSLFKHSGWKNMTDVNYITYLRHNYILQDIIQNTLRYDKPIFCITLILGCSYANILKNIFFILNYFQNHCRYYSREENLINYKYNCTVQLLRTIPLLTSLVIYMGSALDALDKTDKHQTESNDLKNFISSKLVNVLQDKNVLKLLPLLQINLSNYEEALLKVLSLIVEWNEELNNGMSICNINSESLTSLWHNLNNEYHNMQLSGSNIEFYNFLRFKIMTICQWAIQEKYVNLGFKFNTDTKETLIPDLLESSEQEHFEDPIIASTQMLNGDNIEEHFEDPIMASTHMLNDENIEENLNFEDTRNNHETQDKTSLLIDIPEYLRPFNKYL
ncbi:uncharacterized protein LOC126902733 isoform X6 [Daktulosphaira vitifoliae]|uniref:uncharacterized protein LOC126902733 isoform X6 n=1 Tax=Daktulosphaira vitifoliae TaxID=58002 RepID=UPI0021A97F75|nr:uncharacterized protein LOC126902733 isoform X6 [Daktulosphaira vitifoliae]